MRNNMTLSRLLVSILVSFALYGATSFTPTASRNGNVGIISKTSLHFGIPTFGAGKNDDDKKKNEKSEVPEKKIGLSGLAQLITAGMGSPFLGDFEGVEEETGKLMFSLEANNLVDEDGKSKQTSMPYFESGWVSEEDLEKEAEKKGKKGGLFNLW